MAGGFQPNGFQHPGFQGGDVTPLPVRRRVKGAVTIEPAVHAGRLVVAPRNH